jgi:DNA polymerase (family 10)
MASNREIGRLFNLYAELLLLHDKNEELAKLLSGAAYRLRNLNEEVIDQKKSDLAKQFRPDIIQILEELKKAGTINDLDELIQLTPAGLFDMMRIRGLGGKKLSLLWRVAKIDTVDALLEACRKNELSKVPGFGTKTQQNIIEAIEAERSSRDRFHYATVADDAEAILEALKVLFKTKLISLCGEVRRQSTTVAGIEMVAALDAKAFKANELRRFMTVQSSSSEETKGHTLDEIPITIYHSRKENFYRDLFVRTGNAAHVEQVLNKAGNKSVYASEEAVYKAAGLPFVVPEMREDVAEWNFNSKPTDLITLDDIKGVVHNHTTWSDGVDTLNDFVMACKKKKYEYAVISDHSKNAHYAGGLKEEKVMLQLAEIDRLNKELKSFRVFKSIECDILVSGELDYSPEVLRLFDMVIISVHQLLKMDEEKATRRLIKAVENPYTTILGHMTGRQLLIRPGYPVDFKKVIDACAANRVVIEINSNPYRLDMDWSHIPYALQKGVMISINPDAHSIAEIDNIRWGVAAARKGGLTKDMTWNAMPVEKIARWLKK